MRDIQIPQATVKDVYGDGITSGFGVWGQIQGDQSTGKVLLIIHVSYTTSGSFGRVYLGVDMTNGVEVAVKLEQEKPMKDGRTALLEREATIMRNLMSMEEEGYLVEGHDRKAKVSGYQTPTFLWYGTSFGFHALIMELLGPSLADVIKLCNPGVPRWLRRFTLETVAVIGIQGVRALEGIHSLGIVHRDIKPANFLMFNEARTNRLYLIDFGLAKEYFMDTAHVPMEKGKGFTVGTPQFASLNAHKGLTLSRRDDMEALGYILVFFAKGLPWVHKSRPHGARHRGTVDVTYSAMSLNKTSTPIEDLCAGLPDAYTRFLTHVRGLEFDEKPDYEHLVSLLRETLDSDNTGDWDPSKVMCDWNGLAEEGRKEQQDIMRSSMTSFMDRSRDSGVSSADQ